jgi:hypothetical protein
MGGKGRRRDPCTHKAFRDFIVYAAQTLNKLLWECMMERREFSPAELLACLEWKAGSAPDYNTFYNHIIRRLHKAGIITKIKRGRYTLSKTIDLLALAEVLGSVRFESWVSGGGGGGDCVSVLVRSHVVSGSLLEAYASYLFYCGAICSRLVRWLVRDRLKALGVEEARLRRLERCVSKAVRSVRVEGVEEGVKLGGHRGKGKASRELRGGYGNEEHGFDLRICIEKVFEPLLRHWKTYRGQVIGSCRCEEGGSRDGETD